eukprot:m.326917 g.326917  ORF g.326917 m.326917 type:complete len:127 (+) comp16489_c0_seq2:66-446(+)
MPTTDEDELLIAAERGQMERLNKIVARSPTAVHYVNEKVHAFLLFIAPMTQVPCTDPHAFLGVGWVRTGETPLIRAAEQDRPDAVRVSAGSGREHQCPVPYAENCSELGFVEWSGRGGRGAHRVEC